MQMTYSEFSGEGLDVFGHVDLSHPFRRDSVQLLADFPGSSMSPSIHFVALGAWKVSSWFDVVMVELVWKILIRLHLKILNIIMMSWLRSREIWLWFSVWVWVGTRALSFGLSEIIGQWSNYFLPHIIEIFLLEYLNITWGIEAWLSLLTRPWFWWLRGLMI